MTDSNSNVYRERLRQRQAQEHADKGKTGLSKKIILDYSRAAGKIINIWAPRYLPDDNAFDIIPFVITQDWYRKLQNPSGRLNGLEIGMRDYKLQVPIHRNVGDNNDIYLCLREAFGGQCEICDEMFDAYRDGDKDKASGLRARWRVFYNIYDYADPDKPIQLFEISYYSFEGTSANAPQRTNLIDKASLAPSGLVIFSDLEEGKIIVAKFQKKFIGKIDFPEVTDIRFEDREPYDDSILQKVYPLDSMLIIPKSEEIKKAHFGLDEDGENEDTETKNQTSEAAPVEAEQTQTRTRGTGQSQTKTSEETPATSGRRPRETSAPAAEKPAESTPETPEWDKGGNWGQDECPAGKKFGIECNSGPECEGKGEKACTEEVFERCSKAYTEYQNSKPETQTKEKPAAVKAPDKKEEPVTEKPATSGRRKRR